MLTPNQSEALRLLGSYTAGRYDFWALAGNCRATSRAHIMSVLEGKRVPQSKAGVNAMRAAFHAFIVPAGDCIALQDDSFVDMARRINASMAA